MYRIVIKLKLNFAHTYPRLWDPDYLLNYGTLQIVRVLTVSV
jgi:hypothetical protein